MHLAAASEASAVGETIRLSVAVQHSAALCWPTWKKMTPRRTAPGGSGTGNASYSRGSASPVQHREVGGKVMGVQERE